ncbi:MAG: glycoside hydrolase family 3 N-terminal domain-containing protein [Flavobacteriaceae bacterium]|tara:strand:+ start:678 stop:3560 length:2883 start_codon:yes stop_codon:yes gene_type:complete
MRFFSAFILILSIVNGQNSIDPLLDTNFKGQLKWVDSIYNTMNIDEKIGQLFMVRISSASGQKSFDKTEENISQNHIGGLIFSKGSPSISNRWINALQKKSKLPLLTGMDAEWGASMRYDSIKKFPWNMTLGAIQDDELIEEIGYKIGIQLKTLGININFSPVVDINTNPLNPIIGNRSFGEDKFDVTRKSLKMIMGMHRAGILTCAKHFPGHGETIKDSHYDLPLVNFDKNRIDSLELYPYKKLIPQGISSIMVGHLNYPALDDGIPSSLSKKIVDSLLIKKLNFKGLVITDALEMKGVSEFKKYKNISLSAFLAGNDILLIPENIQKDLKTFKKAYNKNIITEERLSLSVKKILKAKYKLGLYNYRPLEEGDLAYKLNSLSNDYLIRKSMQDAITLLKNDSSIPLSKQEKVGFLNLGNSDNLFYDLLSKELNIYEINKSNNYSDLDLDKYEFVIVSYAKSNTSPWINSEFSRSDLEIIETLSSKKKVILVTFTKPYNLSKINLNKISALLLAYQNNLDAKYSASLAIVGKNKINGKLPVSISSKYKYGSGITLKPDSLFTLVNPFDVGINELKLKEIDHLANIAIDSMVAPGMQILAARYGKIFYHKAFGHHTYDKEREVKLSDVYDVASLTKILSTLPILIQEFDKGEILFDNTLGSLSPIFKNTNKENLTFLEIMSYQSGIIPWVPFYKKTLRKRDQKPLRKYYRFKESKKFNIKVSDKLYGKYNLEKLQFESLIDSRLLKKGENYSDLPTIFMQHILEEKYNTSLENLFIERVSKPLKLHSTFYLPLKYRDESDIVPSEIDTYFRQNKLVGYVHDMTASVKGGISGHAGLFSNAFDIAKIMQMFLQKGEYSGLTFFSRQTFDKFNKTYFKEQGNRRAVGFDKPKPKGGGMTFKGISEDSFGHSGFTGTFTWADPETEIIFVFLSNRTYPSMDNRKLIEQNIRTRMQKLLYESIIY